MKLYCNLCGRNQEFTRYEGDAYALLKGHSHGAFYAQSHGAFYDESHGAFYNQSYGLFYDESQGAFHNESQGLLHDQSHAEFYDESQGFLYNQSYGLFYDESHGAFYAQSHAEFYDESQGFLYDQSYGLFYNKSQGAFYNKSQGAFYNKSQGAFHDQSHGAFYNKSQGFLYDQSHGQCYSPYARVILQSLTTHCIGRHIGDKPLPPKEYLASCGITPKNQYALLYKSCDSDGFSCHEPKLAYVIGKETVAPDWDAKFQGECSNGLHLSPTIQQARQFNDHKYYLACRVNIKDIAPLPAFAQFPDKIRVRACVPLYRVDKDGNRLEG